LALIVPQGGRDTINTFVHSFTSAAMVLGLMLVYWGD